MSDDPFDDDDSPFMQAIKVSRKPRGRRKPLSSPKVVPIKPAVERQKDSDMEILLDLTGRLKKLDHATRERIVQALVRIFA